MNLNIPAPKAPDISQTVKDRVTKSYGISLIELGLVIVFLSLAMVPVVQMLGGTNSPSGQGSTDRVIGMKSREIVMANSLIERAIASDFQVFNCNSAFDPATQLPASGATLNLPTSSRCVDNSYNQPLYYQWTVRNLDTTGSILPIGNRYYQLVLNVWNVPTGGTPMLTLPTSMFWNESGGNTSKNTTGIAIVQDISGSMNWGVSSSSPDMPPENAFGQSPNNRAASPYLKYRYLDPTYPAYTPNAPSLIRNLNDNSQLDIVSAMNADDPKTPWDDRYLAPGVNGIPVKNAGINSGRPFDCTDDPAGANSAWWSNLALPWDLQGNNSYRDSVRGLCKATTYAANSANWTNLLDNNLSRIEAARSSLFNFLISIEADPQLYLNTHLGLITFESGVQTRVPMESVDAASRYPNMRRAISWINRNGPGIIAPAGSTNMYGGIQRGAQMVFADKAVDNRIILLVTDGAPTVGQTSHAAFQALSTSIGNGSFPGANCNRATVFTLGLMSDDPAMPLYLQNDIANRTPGGQYFNANGIADVAPIFNQIKYQIQRIILLNKSSRYNVDLFGGSSLGASCGP